MSANVRCLQQVPLLTINLHLGSRQCSQAEPQPHADRAFVQKSQGQLVSSEQAPTIFEAESVTWQPHLNNVVPQSGAAQHAALQLRGDTAAVLSSKSSCSAQTPTRELCQSFQSRVQALHSNTTDSEGTRPTDEVPDCTPAAEQLFPIPHADLTGEYRIPDFVTAQEESELVRMLDKSAPPWKDSTFNGRHRYCQHLHAAYPVSFIACNFADVCSSC